MTPTASAGPETVAKVLEETGQLDNTFILFLGDNGYFFGEHGLGPERRFAYEEGIRSPFLVRYPAWFKPGKVKDDLVLALDIAPTVLDLAGRGGTADLIEPIDGRSLAPFLAGGGGDWPDVAASELFFEGLAEPALMLRKGRYKYVHISRTAELLFDIAPLGRRSA